MKKLTLVMLLNAMLLTACQTQSTLSNSNVMAKPTQSQLQQAQIKQGQTMSKIHTVKSKYTFSDTLNKLTQTIENKGMTVFSIIDHQQAAQNVGLTMQPATVIIFGNPKAGTPLMVKDPIFALQLPLKVLVSEVNGDVLVSFNDTQAMIEGSQIDYKDVENTLLGAEKLIQKTVSE